MVDIEDGLAVVGMANVVTCKLVNGDGKEDGVLPSKLTVPLNDDVAVKYCSSAVSCDSDLFTEVSNVIMLVSI